MSVLNDTLCWARAAGNWLVDFSCSVWPNLFLLKINMGKQCQQALKCNRWQQWTTFRLAVNEIMHTDINHLALLSSSTNCDCVASTTGCVFLITFLYSHTLYQFSFKCNIPFVFPFPPYKMFPPHCWSTGLPRRTQLPAKADVLNGNVRMICRSRCESWHLILPVALSREKHCQQDVKNYF